MTFGCDDAESGALSPICHGMNNAYAFYLNLGGTIMVSKITFLLLIASSNVWAKEVCFIESNDRGYEDNYGYVVTTCTRPEDSSSSRPLSAKVAEVKVSVIKTLIDKGYEIKSDTLLVK